MPDLGPDAAGVDQPDAELGRGGHGDVGRPADREVAALATPVGAGRGGDVDALEGGARGHVDRARGEPADAPGGAAAGAVVDVDAGSRSRHGHVGGHGARVAGAVVGVEEPDLGPDAAALTSQTLNWAGAFTAVGAQVTERLPPLATLVAVDGAVTLTAWTTFTGARGHAVDAPGVAGAGAVVDVDVVAAGDRGVDGDLARVARRSRRRCRRCRRSSRRRRSASQTLNCTGAFMSVPGVQATARLGAPARRWWRWPGLVTLVGRHHVDRARGEPADAPGVAGAGAVVDVDAGSRRPRARRPSRGACSWRRRRRRRRCRPGSRRRRVDQPDAELGRRAHGHVGRPGDREAGALGDAGRRWTGR